MGLRGKPTLYKIGLKREEHVYVESAPPPFCSVTSLLIAKNSLKMKSLNLPRNTKLLHHSSVQSGNEKSQIYMYKRTCTCTTYDKMLKQGHTCTF